jgi:hypothetical protein
VPDTVLALRPMDPRLGLVLRGGQIWDKGRCTFSFPGMGATHFQVTWNMPFNDLPEVDRQLLATRASRIFAARMVGDRQLVGLNESDEREAAAAARRQSARSNRASMLNSYSVGRALRR